MNCLSTFAVCRANSLVGKMSKARAPTILACYFSLFTRGIRNAAVLPLPVLEQATISLPSNKRGMAFL